MKCIPATVHRLPRRADPRGREVEAAALSVALANEHGLAVELLQLRHGRMTWAECLIAIRAAAHRKQKQSRVCA